MKYLVLASILIASGTGGLRAEDAAPPALVPMPKSIKIAEGTFDLNRGTRIVCMNEGLLPLAQILSGEINVTTGFAPLPARPPAKAGDLVLQLDPAMEGEAYSLVSSDRAVVKAGNYDALASATTTLLQLIDIKPGKISMPRLVIEDKPTLPFRSIMIDLGRKYHSPGGIKQVIDLCRFYKIRHLHLHLSDNELFMFPSKKFPKAGKSNHEFQRFDPPSKDKIEPYTRQELVDVDKYASEHGVHLIPELDLPGHAGRLIADEKEAFGLDGLGNTVNIANPKTLKNIDELINEVIDVFQSSKYVHLGADEVSLGGIEKTDDYKKAVQEDPKITSSHDLYSKFIAHLHDLVAARGRKCLVWEEGFNPSGPYPLPKDVVIVAWNGNNNPSLVGNAGYEIVNTTWVPLYIVRSSKKSPKFLFDWNASQFGREGSNSFTTMSGDTSKLIGTQLTSWENPESSEIQAMRERAAIMAERCWNPVDEKDTFDAFKTRWTAVDAKLDRIINPIILKVDGTFGKDENFFEPPLKVTLATRQSTPSGLTIRYTLDGSLPNEKWQTYKEPLTIDKTAFFRAALFDKTNKQVGYEVGAWFHDQNQTTER